MLAPGEKVPQAVAQTRSGSMEQALANGWSRNVLAAQIDARAHTRHGRAVSNFSAALPVPQSDLIQGFSFVGRQYRLDVGDDDFYIDLLFYHLRLRAFVVIKHATDAPTIGLILCQTRDHLLAEYSFAGIDKPIGISTYELTRALPARLRSALPTVEEVEMELSGRPRGAGKVGRKKR